jgi:hypothetical protein
MRSLKDIAVEYFDNHPSEKLVVMEKSKVLFPEIWHGSHHYEWNSKLQDTVCWVCGERKFTKNLKMCIGFQGKHGVKETVSMPEHIKGTLKDEYVLYMDTIKRCEEMVKKKYKSIGEISGKEICELHTTYGCDPETLEFILDGSLSKEVKDEYEMYMEEERTLSRSKQKKEIITVSY